MPLVAMDQTIGDGIQINYHDGMQVTEDEAYKETQQLPRYLGDNRRINVDPVSNTSRAGVSYRPKAPCRFCGLQFVTIIWVFVSGILAVLAICLGAVLGSELQKSRTLQCVGPLNQSLSDSDLTSGAQRTTTVTSTLGYSCTATTTLGYSYTERSLPATSTAISSHTYTSGWCTLHVSQYHRNETDNPSHNFRLDFRIFDGAQALVANFMDNFTPSGHTISLLTLLPAVLNVTAQDADDDPMLFEYNGVSWASNNTRHCSFGGYDDSKREGDCGFTC